MRSAFWALLKWILFKFDAEAVHRLSVSLIRLGASLGGWILRLVSGASARARIELSAPAQLPSPLPRVWGIEFASCLGLAAGFDKDAEILSGLPELGFGFAEIGTVTPRPQPGNDRPRLFRDIERQAIFNRMGFNGLGATIVSERLAKIKPTLPTAFRVGVNVGKNKETSNEEAARDYAHAAKAFEGLADYLVINVSSPNTPGLRALQTAEALKPIVGSVLEGISGWKHVPPLLLKLAPEVRGDALTELIRAAEGWGIQGWVLTNTLAGTWGAEKAVAGGWSGGPLTQKSRESLVEARLATRLPIISVGGILTPNEAVQRRELGADLVQIYTGWILGGPDFPVRVSRALAAPVLDRF